MRFFAARSNERMHVAKTHFRVPCRDAFHDTVRGFARLGKNRLDDRDVEAFGLEIPLVDRDQNGRRRRIELPVEDQLDLGLRVSASNRRERDQAGENGGCEIKRMGRTSGSTHEKFPDLRGDPVPPPARRKT